MKKLFLIDGNSIVFRAYFATAYPGAVLMQTQKGEYTNALFAFINMFEKIVSDVDDHILVAFDTKEKTKRHLAFDGYKAGRAKMPDELASQLPIIDQYLDVMGITHYKQAGYEADDIIGTLANTEDYEVHIYSSDKDLLQLVRPNVTVHLLKKGMKEVHDFTPELVLETYELTYHQMIDLKALMGDPSDNIPGIPGVGEKTAIQLLKTYGTVDEVLAHREEIKGKLGEKIREHAHLAELSKSLVIIDREAQLNIGYDDLKRKTLNQTARMQFLQYYELHMLAKQLDVSKEFEDWDFDIIQDDASLKAYLEVQTALIMDFSDSNYHEATLWGIGIATKDKQAYIDPSYAFQSQLFISYLQNPSFEKATYDAKAQMVYTKWQGYSLKGVTFDLLLSSYILDAHIGKEEFKRVVASFDYHDVEYEENIYGKGVKKGLPTDQSHFKHLASKAKAIFALKNKQIEALKEKEQYELFYNVELKLSTVLASMEYEGIQVDLQTLDDIGLYLKDAIEKCEKNIYALSGKTFNISSPKQLGVVLFEQLNLPHGKKTKTGYSTNVEVLEKLKHHHPIIETIMTYRGLTKLFSTYIEGLRPYITKDLKIHTIYMQALTTTGRLSSVEPNLQNIPIRTEEGRNIRKIFKASKGRMLVGADYSQIELRVLSHIADVKALKEAFIHHQDIHEETAKKVFNLEQVTSEQRRQAKAVNFGIIYGMSAWSLADDIHVTQKEAQKFIDTYLEVYPEIKKYMEEIVIFAKTHGYVETILKRRRYIPELQSDAFMQRAFGERLAMNAPIQGSAADILKLAMIHLHEALEEKGLKSKLILQVHDELIMDVYVEELEEVKALIQKTMMEAYPLAVSLETSLDVGHTWYEVK
jgi:DNA polymerase-1